MKLKYIYHIAALSALFFSACMQDDTLMQEDISSPGAFSIRSVSVADFSAGSRVSNDGVTVTFEDGDRIGLMLVDADGNATENIPFEYANGVWNNVEDASYSGKIRKAVAYFPYVENLSPVASADELKGLDNWASAEEFKDRDLLVSEIEVNAPELTVDFEHAFSLVSFSAEGSVTAGEETYTFPIDLSDVSFSIGDERYVPEAMDGKYLCLMDGGELNPNDFRYFYTIGGTTYAKTLSETLALESNHCYTFPCLTSDGEEASVAPGDFYCVSDAGNAVVIPGNAASLPAGLACKGIVFHTMDGEEFGSFAMTNGLASSDYAGFNGSHGLVVSIVAGQSFGGSDDATVKGVIKEALDGLLDVTNEPNGYKITQILKEKAAEAPGFLFVALNNHSEKIAGATEWYAPSFHELKYLIRGSANPEAASADGADRINRQMGKVNGATLTGNIPSVTYHSPEVGLTGFYLMASGTGNDSNWYGIAGEVYHPICAF